MELSVLIATHHRPDILVRTLDHLDAQRDAPRFEVVVVIDGDHDYGPATLDRRRAEAAYPLAVHQEPHRGQAGALNRALAAATGRRVLVLGDDQFAAEDLLARHHRRLEELNAPHVAVQGRVAWHPEILPDPFLDFETRHGILFAYPRMEKNAFVDLEYLYTCNISFDRAWLAGIGGFVEGLPCWTDTVFSFRARPHGLRLFYDPDAVAWHHDRWTLDRACRRRYVKGRLAAELVERDPAFRSHVLLPRLDGWRRMRHGVSRVLRPIAERTGPRAVRDWCWSHAINHRFATGYEDAAAGRPDPGGTW